MRVQPVRVMKHGNGTSIGIPAAIRRWLGWQPDELLMAEVTEDGRLTYRRFTSADAAPHGVRPFMAPPTPASK